MVCRGLNDAYDYFFWSDLAMNKVLLSTYIFNFREFKRKLSVRGLVTTWAHGLLWVGTFHCCLL